VADWSLNLFDSRWQPFSGTHETAFKSFQKSPQLAAMYSVLLAWAALATGDGRFSQACEKILPYARIEPWHLLWFGFLFSQDAKLPQGKDVARSEVAIFEDISTFRSFNNEFDCFATLLGGYNSLAEVHWDNLTLSAAGPEIDHGSHYLHFGINSKRLPYDHNVELKDSYGNKDVVILRGNVPTMNYDPEQKIMVDDYDSGQPVGVDIDILLAAFSGNLLLATRPTGRVKEAGYQFVLMVEIFPDIQVKVGQATTFKPALKVENDKIWKFAPEDVVIESPNGMRLMISPLRTVASQLIIEQVSSGSPKARYRNDLRIVFAGEDMSGESTFLISGISADAHPPKIEMFQDINFFEESLEDIRKVLQRSLV